MLLSGARESEVRYLADQVGVSEIHSDKSPEEKLSIVRAATAAGYLPPVAGTITQEVIDVVAVANALRVAVRPTALTDY